MEPYLDNNKKHKTLSNQELQIIANQSGVMIARFDIANRIEERFYNADEKFGLAEIEYNVPFSLIESGKVAPESVHDYLQFFQDMIDGIPSGKTDIRLKTLHHEFRWHHASYTLIFDDNKKPIYSIIIFFDNTKEREMALTYEKWHSNFASLLTESLLYAEFNLTQNTLEAQEGSPEHLRHQEATHSFESFIEYGKEHFTHPDDFNEYVNFFNRERLITLFKSGTCEDKLEYRTFSSGRYIWIRANIQMIEIPQTHDILAILAYIDIDKKHCEIEKLAQQASHDSLTKLLNRGTMKKAIQDKLDELKPNQRGTLYIVDIDNFKQVNDKLGHICGDETLKQIANTLAREFNSADIIARLGGDEFIVFTSDYDSSIISIMQKASHLINVLQFNIGNRYHQLNISASIGIAYTFKNNQFDYLYQLADQQLYQAKDRGKCQYCLINAESENKKLKVEESYTSSLIPLNSILENMEAGVIVAEVEKKLNILYISPSYYKSMGFTVSQTGENGEHILSFIHPDDIQAFYSLLDNTVKHNKTHEYTYRSRLPKEGYVWRQMRLINMGSNRVLCLIKDMRDIVNITERVSYLRKLLFSQKDICVWEMDITNKRLNNSLDFMKNNQFFKESLCIPEGVIQANLIDKDYHDQYRIMCHDIFNGIENKTYQLKVFDGDSYCLGECHYILIRNNKNVPYYAIGIFEKTKDVETSQ